MRSRNLPRAWLFDFSRLNSLVLGHVDMVMSVTLVVNDLLWNLSQKKIPSFYSLTWFCGLSTTSHGPPQQVDGYMSCGQCSCWSHVKWSDCIIYVNSGVSNCGSVCFHVCISVQVIYCAILLLRISWSKKKSCIMSDRGRKEEIRSTSVWTVLLKPSETWLWVSRVSRCFTLTRLSVWL